MALIGKRGSTRAWRVVRELVLVRDDGLCQVPTDGGRCLQPATHVDHVIPRSRWPEGLPGVDAPGNLRAACAPCNLRRGADQNQLVRTWGWT